MEVSFLKDAINRIAEMAQPFVMEVDGRKYCSANMCEVEGQGEKPLPYRVDTLDALIQLIRTEGVKTYEKLFVRVKDPHTVLLTVVILLHRGSFTTAPLSIRLSRMFRRLHMGARWTRSGP